MQDPQASEVSPATERQALCAGRADGRFFHFADVELVSLEGVRFIPSDLDDFRSGLSGKGARRVKVRALWI